MTIVSSAAALLAGTVLVAATPVAPIKYKAVISSKQVVDLSAFGQGNQETAQTTTSYFQLEVRDSAGGRVITVIIDSLVPDEAIRAQIPAPIVDSAKGATYRIFQSATGATEEKTITAGGPLAQTFAASVVEFLPRVKGTLGAGAAWSDTTENSRTIPNGALKSKTVTNYSATAADKIGAAFAASLTGAQETPGGTADLAGTSTGTAEWALAADKSLVSVTRKEESTLSVTLAAAPAPIPVTQTQEATITRLP